MLVVAGRVRLVVRVSPVAHGLDRLCLFPLQLDLDGRVRCLARVVLFAAHLAGYSFCAGRRRTRVVLFGLAIFRAAAVGIGSPAQFRRQRWRDLV